MKDLKFLTSFYLMIDTLGFGLAITPSDEFECFSLSFFFFCLQIKFRIGKRAYEAMEEAEK